jgi:ubiquitin-small subunit ribosomal protein S27Ae
MADKKGASSGPKQMSVSKLYSVSGNSVKRAKKTCPKCGDGYFLAEHKDRLTCGNCHYMEKHK